MKILVTGGAGFIGSNVVDAYIEQGHEVSVVDNLSTGFIENVNPDAKFFEMDIRDKEIEELFKEKRFDVVNHHAAQMDVRKSVKDPLYDASINVLGSINFFENALKYGATKIIYISTGGAVYGEPKYLPVDEDHPIEPICPYGITKHTVEHYLFSYHENFGLQYTVLRYPNVYGPRQNPHGEAGVIAIFSEQMISGEQPKIFGDGLKTRDYVYISDVVKANLMVLEQADGYIFNLGWGKEITDFEVFDTVRVSLNKNLDPIYVDRRIGEIERISLDASRVRDVIGWIPEVAFPEGVRMSVEFYKQKLAKS